MMLLSAVLLTALVTALISVKSTLLIVRRRQLREITEPVRQPAVSDRVEDAITAFGEELDQLTFDPSTAQTIPAAVKDYRLALDAYEKAKTAGSAEAALAALQGGRAALIRLDARQHGRPVPIEALQLEAIRDSSTDAVSVEATTERFVSIGTGPGKAEVLIDRPEPRRPVIAEIAYKGGGNFFTELMVRTRNRHEYLEALANAIGPYRGRHYLPVEATHLKVETKNAGNRWSVRFKPLSEAVPMQGNEHHGKGDEVVAYTGGRAQVTAQVRSDGVWKAAFRCGSCDTDENCTCPTRFRNNDWVHGLDDGRQTFRVPGPGWIVIQLNEPGTWSLHAAPHKPRSQQTPHQPQNR